MKTGVMFVLFVAMFCWAGRTSAQEVTPAFIEIPGGEGGVGFDDLTFARGLGAVLVPGGGTGQLILVDPQTKEVESIGALNRKKNYRGGHGEGITSADEGDGFLFTIDRTAMTLNVIDPSKEMVVSSIPLAGSPDYVRYVGVTGEIWVTEPDHERIEIFSFSKDSESMLRHAGFIVVSGGPESLVVDRTRQRAYTHLWSGTTVAIDLKTRELAGQWPNGCAGSRGIALDEKKGFLFVGCAEGKAVVLNVSNGEVLGSLSTGSGVDVIGYNPQRSHLYLAGASSATLSILDISKEGVPQLLAVKDTVKGAHCAVADNLDGIWVCDPDHGRLLFFKE